MAETGLSERRIYEHSGKVKFARLAVLSVFPLAISLGLAYCMYLLLENGAYISILVPLVASLFVAGACYFTVRWSHCRNLAVAGVFGCLAALILVLGRFHIAMVMSGAADGWFRLDELPGFIARQMNGIAEDVIFSWIYFLIELVIVVSLVIGASLYRAARAYCESCGKWARLAVVTLPPGSGQPIATALAGGAIEKLPLFETMKVKVGNPATTVTVECCPETLSGGDCLICLTVHELTKAPGVASKAKKANYVKKQLITPEELSLLADKLPELQPVAPVTAKAVLPAITVDSPSQAAAHATVITLPEGQASNVYTAKTTAIKVALSLLPIAALLGGIGLIVIAALQKPWQGDLDAAKLAVVAGLGVAGLGLTIFGAAVCWVNVDFFNFRYGYRLTKREIAMRPDALVATDDPHAIYVEIVPRAHWTQLVQDRATDGGLLLLDHQRQELLFEGMKERYRIPAAAVVSCEAEVTQPQAGRFAFLVTVVQAYVRTDSPQRQELWEAPFMVRPVKFARFNGAWRRQSAEDLCDEIRQLSAYQS